MVLDEGRKQENPEKFCGHTNSFSVIQNFLLWTNSATNRAIVAAFSLNLEEHKT